jgi:hypothetical protein
MPKLCSYLILAAEPAEDGFSVDAGSVQIDDAPGPLVGVVVRDALRDALVRTTGL